MKKGAENCLSQRRVTLIQYLEQGQPHYITGCPAFQGGKHMKKIKYRVCPLCGAHLDFSERCDCEKGGAQK